METTTGTVEEDIMKQKKTVKKVRKPKAAKTGKAPKLDANGVGSRNTVTIVKPAPKDGPNLTLRMRTEADIAKIKKAAEKQGLSMNTWAVEVLGLAAEAQ